jgi:lipopolysaccharide export system protein LptA
MKTRVPLWLFVIAIVGGMLQPGFGQTPDSSTLSPTTPNQPSVSSEPPPANGKKPISFSARSVQGVLAKDKQTTVLIGSVKIATGSLVITADRVELSGEDYKNVVCSGNVTVNDSEKGFSLVAEKLNYQRDTEIGIAQGKVNVNDTKNNTIIDAEWLRFDQQQSIFEAAVSVLVLKEDMSIRAEYAHYNRNTEEIKLHGGAIAITEDGNLKGDVISATSDWSNLQISGEVSGIITTEKSSPSQ